MAMTSCPECSGELSDKAFVCPHCGAPTGQPLYCGYSYKSRATFLGMPLVHIAQGFDPGTRRPRIACGFIAIGQVAFGVFALGGISIGGVCLGGISFGLVSLGGIALGLVLAVGGLAVGGVALGGLAIGVYAFGGGAYGMYRISGMGVDPALMEQLKRLGIVPNR